MSQILVFSLRPLYSALMIKKSVFAFVVLGLLGYAAFFFASRVSRTVKVSRTFDAPIERVWSNWNDPETIKRWWSPKGYTAPIVTNDFRVGGTYFYAMKSPGGDLHYNTGTYTDIALNKKIVSKMSFADESGKAISASDAGLPGKWPDYVEVLVEFEDVKGQKSTITVTETGIPLIMSVFAKMGWEQQFDKFELVIK